jgi:hypothetical protein
MEAEKYPRDLLGPSGPSDASMRRILEAAVKSFDCTIKLRMVSVPDRRRRIIPEVVLVRCGQSGFWEFGGGRVWVKGWDRGGQFTSNLRPRWTDPVTARRVPSK